MSHHFDTKLAKEDPSLNVCDLYLFRGAPDTTVMAMTVNPDVVLSAPDTLHIEGLYAFRLDLTGDAREDVVFKFRFNEPRHLNGDEHVHVQKFPCLGHGVTLRPCSRDAGVTLGPSDDHAPLSQRSRQSRGERDLQQIGAIRGHRFVLGIHGRLYPEDGYLCRICHDPEEYGKQMVSRLCPNILPYELGTAAASDVAGFNGRPLGDDVMDVMLTLASNRPLQDGAAPDRNRIRGE
jgi:hypothetical protein